MTDLPSRTAAPLSHEDLVVEYTLKLWWQRRKLIAAVLVGALIVFTLILLLIPRSYRAQASIIFMPPRFAPEARAVPLAVPTAKTLLETQELYDQVKSNIVRYRGLVERLVGREEPAPALFSKLEALSPQEIGSAVPMTETEALEISNLSASELRGILEFEVEELEALNVDSIGEMLTSREAVEKKTASDLVYSPVLQLFAVADTGSKAQVLVNTWARLFEKKYEALTRGQTQRPYNSLSGQQEEGQRELETIQKTLVDFRLANNLELIQRQIRDKSETFSSFSQQLVGRNNELAGLQAKLSALLELTRGLESQETGWVGAVLVDSQTSSPTGLTLGFREEAVVPHQDSSPTTSLLRNEVVRSRRSLMQAIETATAYHAQNPLPLLQSEEERIRREYIQQVSDVRTSSVYAAVLRKSLEELNARLAETSPALTLSTGLPSEVVGNAVASRGTRDLSDLAQIQFLSQQVNPEWSNYISQRADIAQKLASAEAAIAELKMILPEKEKEVKRAGEQAFQAAQGDVLVRQQVERYQELNESLFASYGRIKEELFQTGLRVTLVQQEIRTITDTINRLMNDIESLRESYEAAAAEVEIINLRKGAVEQRAELLTTKLQESLVALGEQVTDVSIASKAVPPAKHFWPPRSLLLAAMLALTTAILLAGLSRRRYRELTGAFSGA